jgi:hypothetical protein
MAIVEMVVAFFFGRKRLRSENWVLCSTRRSLYEMKCSPSSNWEKMSSSRAVVDFPVGSVCKDTLLIGFACVATMEA